MNRFFTTVLLALVIVGGLWVLFNQQQIQQAGGLSAYVAQTFGTSRSNAFQQSSWNRQSSWNSNWNQQSNWTTGLARFQKTTDDWQAPNQFARQRTGIRPDLSPTSKASVPIQFASQSLFSGGGGDRPGLPPRSANKIRIASFKMNANSDPVIQLRSLELLTDLCSQFDIIAFQEINSQSISLLEQIGQKAAANSGGAIQFRAISDVAKVGPGNLHIGQHSTGRPPSRSRTSLHRRSISSDSAGWTWRRRCDYHWQLQRWRPRTIGDASKSRFDLGGLRYGDLH